MLMHTRGTSCFLLYLTGAQVVRLAWLRQCRFEVHVACARIENLPHPDCFAWSVLNAVFTPAVIVEASRDHGPRLGDPRHDLWFSDGMHADVEPRHLDALTHRSAHS